MTKNIYSLLKLRYLFWFSLIILPLHSNSQTYLSDKTISMEEDYSDDSYTVEARDEITLLPGFIFSSSSDDNTFDAYIDNKLILDLGDDYLETEEVPSSTPGYDLPVGSIPGNFNVNATGAATYSIPIAISPGTQGLQPNISIVYNSQAGNGILGMGWNISGLSAITRVGANIFSDEEAGGVNFDDDDKFALDGNRLLVKTGTYGEAASTYETQNQTFNTITAIGTLGNGPKYFTVQTTDGKTLYYGSTSDSRATAINKTTPYMWRLTKVVDKNKNYMKYHYKKYNGESVIDYITYTGNSNADKEPYNTLHFYYDEKADTKKVYISGNKIIQSLVLREIRAYHKDDILWKYNFEYTESTFTHLNKIIQSNSDGSELNPTIINWGEDNNSIAVTEDVNLPSPDPDDIDDKEAYFYSCDFNGDGLSDIIESYSYDEYIYFDLRQAYLKDDNSVSFKSIYKDYSALCPETYLLGAKVRAAFNNCAVNIDNDANTEFVFPYYYNVTDDNYAFLLDVIDIKNGAVIKNTIMTSESSDIPAFNMGDIDNDGISELIYIDQKEYDGTYNGRIIDFIDGEMDKEAEFTVDFWVENMAINDFDGDGLNDILFLSPNDGYHIYKNTGGTNESFHFEEAGSGDDFNSDFNDLHAGDFNGDGLMDFLCNEECSANWFVAINNGDFTFTTSSSTFKVTEITGHDESCTTSNDDNDYCLVTDFNNDGMSDIIMTEAYFDQKTNALGNVTGGTFTKFNIVWYASTGSGITTNKSLTTYDEEDYSLFRNIVSGDFNGDGRTDIINYGSDLYSSVTYDEDDEEQYRMYSAFNDDFDDQKVVSITDGFNNTTNISYQPLTYEDTEDGETFYTTGSSSTYPLVDFQGAMYCVSKTTQSQPDGIDGTTDIDYNYTDARIHANGLGLLGFKEFEAINSNTGITTKTKTTLDEDYFVPSTVVKVITNSSDEKISNTKSTFGPPEVSNGAIFNMLSSVLKQNYNDGTSYSSNTTSYTYDDDGLLTYDKIKYSDGSYISHNYDNYVLGKPELVITTSKHKDDEDTFTSKVFCDYETSTGNLLEKIDNYEVEGKEITTTYSDFNDFGLPTTITTSADDVETYTKNLTYDDTKRFITQEENDFGTITRNYNASNGLLTLEEDENGLTTTYTFDKWGRNTGITTPTGVNIYTSFAWDSDGENYYALYYTYKTATNTNSPWEKVYYDSYGREVKKESVRFSDVEDQTDISIYKDIYYNSLGQVDKIYSGVGVRTGISNTIEYSYNENGQVSDEVYGYGKSISYAYNGLSTTTTINGYEYTRTYDCLGKLVKQEEPLSNHTISYTYRSNGKPDEITIPGGVVSFDYDAVGNQTSLNDPDAGTMEYEYDAYGRITYQKDNNDDPAPNEFTIFYDDLGRISSSTDQNGLSTSYAYVLTGNGKNQLLSESFNGVSKTYTYDSYGRIKTTTEHISDDIDDQVYQYTYNTNNQVKTITYPSNLVVENTYDDYGNLYKISADDELIWELTGNKAKIYSTKLGNGYYNQQEYDGYGFLTSCSNTNIDVGYSYKYDYTTGNIKSREDHLSGYTEEFGYDEQNRLTSSTYNSTSFSYEIADDGTGNIGSKTDVGTYVYGNSDSPHQLTQLTEAVDDMEYQNISYNSFGKIETITQGDIEYNLVYGPDKQRSSMELTNDGTTIGKTYYTDASEIKIKDDITRHISYISSDRGLIAIDVKRSDGNDTLYYVYTDNLGSILALSNNHDDEIQYQNFDAWGRYRDPETWEYSTTNRITAINRGFTGHEHLLAANLINMNGRVYDPLLGRFLSPDNYVQMPDNTQSFNRYAYCMNNPLIYTDPNGYWWGYEDAIVAGIGFAVGYVAYGVATDNWGWKAVGAGVVCAVVADVAYNTLGASAAAGENATALEAVFGSAGGNYGMSFATTTYMNTMMHEDALNAADEQGWDGVWAMGAYSASSAISSSLKISSDVKYQDIRNWIGIVITDNLSENMENGTFSSSRYHIGLVGYDFDTKNAYSIFSNGLSNKQRFDMGYETIAGLSLIKYNVDFDYRLWSRDITTNKLHSGLERNFYLESSKIGNIASEIINISDKYFQSIYGQSTYEYWYSLHYNKNGTAIY